MYAKKYILFIVFLLILSSCGSTEVSPNQEDNKSVNSNKTSEDNFDETANEEDSSIEYNDNFGDEDGCNEEEDENNCEEEVCDEIYGCLVRDESGWLNVMQNFTNYSPPVLPKLDKPEFSKNVWHQTNGPFSGIVVAAVKSQTGFWAATDGETFSISNIYFLEKGNSVWKKMKSVNAAMLNVVVNPNNPNQVAFATKEPEPAIYISNDGGVNWSTANISSFSSKNFSYLAVGNENPFTLYVGVGESDGNTEKLFIYTSTDSGKTWSKSESLPTPKMNFKGPYDDLDENIDISGILVITPHPHDNKVLYVGTWTSLVVTKDGGKSWKNLTEGWYRSDIKGIAISKEDPNIIYARLGVRLSIDCEELDNLKERSAPEEEIIATWEAYCPGVIKSIDGGETWQKLNTFEVDQQSGDSAEGEIYINPYNENFVYNVWSRIVTHSWDKGNEWDILFGTPQFPQIPNVGIHSLIIGDNFSELYIGSIGGFFNSDDHGKSWDMLTAGIIGTEVLDIEIAVDGTLYAATDNHGVWKSEDQGISWSYISFGIDNFYGMQLLTHPTNLNIVYYTTSSGVYKTENGGELWKFNETLCPGQKGDNHFQCHYHGLVIDPENPDHVLIGGGGDEGTPDGVGINKSIDSGTSWFESDEGFIKDVHVSKMVVDPSDSNIFYATTQGNVTKFEKEGDGQGVFKSVDKGKTWKQINDGLETVETNVLVVDPNDSNILYLGTDDDGLYKSTNGGESWDKMFFPGITEKVGIGDILVDPLNSQVVFVGTLDYFRLNVDEERGMIGDYGIYRTLDGGETWEEFNYGLDHLGIFSLELDTENRILYAGTRLGGVYWLDVSN